MGSFEVPVANEGEKDQKREQVVREVKKYFEEYVSEADNYESDDILIGAEDVYTDLEKIKGILKDIESNDFSSAYDYLDSEAKRMEGIHQKMREEGGMSVGDIEDGLPYLERVTRLRDSLIIQE